MTSGVLAEWASGESEQDIEDELLQMVNDGLLKMGVSSTGEPLFWPTESGCEALGMVDESQVTKGVLARARLDSSYYLAHTLTSAVIWESARLVTRWLF